MCWSVVDTLQHAEWRDNYLRFLVFIGEVAWKKDYLRKTVAFGFVATMQLLSNYYSDLLVSASSSLQYYDTG